MAEGRSGVRNIVTFNALGRYGRFANGMFQIASTIGIARKNGFDFAFPCWKNYMHAESFGSTEDIDVQKHFVNPLPVYDGPPLPDRFIDWGYQDVRLTESVSLSGHMQSVKYFEHCLDEAKWYFRMKDEPPQNDYVAVHVRLTDYDDAYHPRLGLSYYARALALFPCYDVLIFSDDIPACKEMFAGVGVKFSEGRDYLEDFKLMKTCRHFIIGNSSYSAMAAILADHPEKRVIAPRPWFGHKYTNITGEDIYGSDWEVVDYQIAEAT